MKLQIPVDIEMGFPEVSAGCALMFAAIEYSHFEKVKLSVIRSNRFWIWDLLSKS